MLSVLRNKSNCVKSNVCEMPVTIKFPAQHLKSDTAPISRSDERELPHSQTNDSLLHLTWDGMISSIRATAVLGPYEFPHIRYDMVSRIVTAGRGLPLPLLGVLSIELAVSLNFDDTLYIKRFTQLVFIGFSCSNLYIVAVSVRAFSSLVLSIPVTVKKCFPGGSLR